MEKYIFSVRTPTLVLLTVKASLSFVRHKYRQMMGLIKKLDRKVVCYASLILLKEQNQNLKFTCDFESESWLLKDVANKCD